MGIKDKVLNGKGLAELVKKIKEAITGNVVANPTIPEGVTPTALSDLKIGNNYFSAGGGGSDQHLYQHTINANTGNRTGNISFTLVTNSVEPLTIANLKTLLRDSQVSCSGWSYDGAISNCYYIKTIWWNSSTSKFNGNYMIKVLPSVAETNGIIEISESSMSNFTDYIRQII